MDAELHFKDMEHEGWENALKWFCIHSLLYNAFLANMT